jgi:hypothetical protein
MVVKSVTVLYSSLSLFPKTLVFFLLTPSQSYLFRRRFQLKTSFEEDVSKYLLKKLKTFPHLKCFLNSAQTLSFLRRFPEMARKYFE